MSYPNTKPGDKVYIPREDNYASGLFPMVTPLHNIYVLNHENCDMRKICEYL